jgi:hypothetical protein
VRAGFSYLKDGGLSEAIDYRSSELLIDQGRSADDNSPRYRFLGLLSIGQHQYSHNVKWFLAAGAKPRFDRGTRLVKIEVRGLG